MCPASFGTFVKLRTNLRTADELQHVLRIIPVAAEKCLAPREKLKRPKKQIYAKKKGGKRKDAECDAAWLHARICPGSPAV